MICKFCGTESKEANCPKCGMPMTVDRPSSQYASPYTQPQAQQSNAWGQQYAQPQAQQSNAWGQQYAQPQAQQSNAWGQQYAQPQTQQSNAWGQQYAQPQEQQYSVYQPGQSQYDQYAQYAQYGQYNRYTAQQAPQQSNTQSYAVVPSSTSLPVAKQAERNRTKKPVIRLKKVVWPSIALLLPLLYLFFEMFAVLVSDFAKGDLLNELFSCLTSGTLSESDTIGDAVGLFLPNKESFYQRISPLFILELLFSGKTTQAMPLLLPIVISAVLIALCVIFALMLLASGGRLLRSGVFHTALHGAALGATFSPLLGMLTLWAYYVVEKGMDRADALMQNVVLSVESLMIMGFLCCTLLPALGALRKLSAKDAGNEGCPLMPFRFTGRLSFGTLKTTMIIVMSLAFIPFVLMLVLPVSTLGFFGLEWLEDPSSVMEMFEQLEELLGYGSFTGASAFAFAAVILMIGAFAAFCLLLWYGLCALLHMLRLLLLKRDKVAQKRSAKRFVASYGKHCRGFVIAPFVICGLAYAVAAMWILFATPLSAHLDFSNVEEALGAFYMSLFCVKRIGGFTSVFNVVALVGAVIWHTQRQLGQGMLTSACKKTTARK